VISNLNYLSKTLTIKENKITDLLAAVMSKKYVRDILLNEIGIDNNVIETISFKDISTQARVKGRKKPDLAIVNKDVYLLLENKIYLNTDLQDSQIHEYIDAVKESEAANKYLIYLIPKSYKHLNVLEKTKNQYEKIIKIVYWSDIVDSIIKNDLLDTDEATKQVFNYIISALGLGKRQRIFTRGELMYMSDVDTMENVRNFHRKYFQYTKDCALKIKDHYAQSFPLPTITPEDADGHYCTWLGPNNEDKYCIFIGCSFIKNRDAKYTYNIQIKSDWIKKEIEEEYKTSSRWRVFKIDPKIFFNENNVVDALFERVRFLLDKYVDIQAPQ